MPKDDADPENSAESLNEGEEESSRAENGDDTEEKTPEKQSWRELWQIPTLGGGLLLLAMGVVMSSASAPGPDFDAAMDDVALLIEGARFDESLAKLNNEILPHLVDKEATREDRRRFHLLRGDTIYRAQVEQGLDVRDNHLAVLAEYDEAEKLLAQLSPAQQSAYADTLISLGRFDEARRWLDDLPESQEEWKRSLLKRMVMRSLEAEGVRVQFTLDLLSELAAAPTLSDDDRLWMIARQAQLRLDSGEPEEALTHMLRAIQRHGKTQRLSGSTGGEIYLYLARAYFEMGRFEDAERQLHRALDEFPETDPTRGAAFALQGRMRQMAGDLQEARDSFTIVVNDYPATGAELPAMLGLAEVEAALGNATASLSAYQTLAEQLPLRTRRGSVTKESLASSLALQHQERFVRADYDNALRYVRILESLQGEDVTAGVYLMLARTLEALANDLIAPARDTNTGDIDLSLIDQVTRAEGRAYFAQAGDYYIQHARAIILEDPASQANSLWKAGEDFDFAGETDRAIEAYNEFASGHADDPRHPLALFRIGMAHMANNEHALAAQFFKDLIDTNPKSSEGSRSYLKLAQAYLLDDNMENDAEAERLLSMIVDGRLRLSPETPEFRNALFELGRLLLRADRYEDAIRRLDEAVRRFPDDVEIAKVKFRLAEAHRLSAVEMDRTLQEAMPEGRRRELMAERNSRLRRAAALYDEMHAFLDARTQSSLSPLEQLYQRNALFFMADCAFDLGEYDAAITHYDAAAQRYADDPASLVAMMQIVNAYVAQGAWAEAQTANERAQRRLNELPDAVFDDPSHPGQKSHWERWFESSAQLAAHNDSEE